MVNQLQVDGYYKVSLITDSSVQVSVRVAQSGVSGLVQASVGNPDDLLMRYTHVFHVQVAQTAACNAHHELGQRLHQCRAESADASLLIDLDTVGNCRRHKVRHWRRRVRQPLYRV